MASILSGVSKHPDSDPHGGLDALFSPRSVAVIGASSDQRRFGGRPIQYLIEAGFEGPIYPVNPKRSEIQGLTAYASVSDIPGPVDCAMLALDAAGTERAIAECIEKGVRSAILFGAGFSESGGEGTARQDRIIASARGAGMRLLGPNCMGLMNAHDRFYATFASALEEGVPAPGRIGVASQSGGYGGYLMKHFFLRRLGISKWVTTGNEADVDVGEALWWMAGQDDTDVLVAYIEGLRDADKLIDALERAKALRKPVVVMKVGRTAEGSAAAASHTASLTGEDSIYDAIFDKYDVFRARTTDELLDIAYALSKGNVPAGPRVGVISISGGVGVQIADFVSDAGLCMGTVSDDAQDVLRALVPHCSPRNPIDMTGIVTTNHEIMEKTLDAVFAANSFDAIVIFLGITGVAPSMARPLQDAIARAHARAPKQLIFVSVTADRDMIAEYDEKGMYVFEDPSRAIAAISALNRHRLSADRHVPAPPAIPPADRLPDGGAMNEADAKAFIEHAGIPSPRECLVTDAEQAAAFATETGFPVAVKVVSADILHKSEYGGVALGLADADAVHEAVTRMARDIPAALPDAAVDGYLVSEMITGGVETIVGITADPTFGPVVTLGLGGTMVELIKDTVCARAPVGVAEARDMIDALKTAPLLKGYRGAPALDVDALAAAISGLSVLAVQYRDDIATIEVNPLVVRENGLVALDAVIEKRDK